jgi:hypothetical protein
VVNRLVRRPLGPVDPSTTGPVVVTGAPLDTDSGPVAVGPADAGPVDSETEGPPLSALRRPMYRPDGEPIDPADIRIELEDLGPDDETEL